MLAQPLRISAYGLTTPVGRGASACAAIRAGLTRARPCSEIQTFDPETFEPAPLLAHTVEGLSEGFLRFARWRRLASDAFAALRATSVLGSPPAALARTRLVVATRPIDADFLQLADDDASAQVVTSAFRQRFLEPLSVEAGLSSSAEGTRSVAAGSPGVIRAVIEAGALLREPGCDRVVVLAVDSWIDPGALADAAANQRVRVGGEPTGFIPGEAAAAFVLERESPGAQGPRLVGAALGREADSPLEKAGGPALADSIEHVLRMLGSETFLGDVFVDLNGEEWRALQWGNALVRLGAKLAGARIRLVAGSVGDAGAASSAVALATALESQRRGWARGATSLVVTAAETGETGCLAVERADR